MKVINTYYLHDKFWLSYLLKLAKSYTRPAEWKVHIRISKSSVDTDTIANQLRGNAMCYKTKRCFKYFNKGPPEGEASLPPYMYIHQHRLPSHVSHTSNVL